MADSMGDTKFSKTRRRFPAVSFYKFSRFLYNRKQNKQMREIKFYGSH